MVPLVSALLQWHNPPQLSDGRLTKWVSRWQLCMSATLAVGRFEVIETRDLLSVTTGAVLTDGCGRIGCGLADLIADNIRKTSVKYQKIGLLSAVQIRIGGAKGMLIIEKALAHDNMTVYVRRSVMKIIINDASTLEVENWVDDIAHQPYANLNNEVIPLLEDAALRAGVAREATEQRVFKILAKNVLKFITYFVGLDSADEDVVSMSSRMRECRQDCTCVLGHAPHAKLAQHLMDLRAQRPMTACVVQLI